MAKVTMSWNLPEEKDDYELHHRAGSMFCALHDIYQYLRTNTKYYDGQSGLDEETLRKVYKEFWDILNNNEIGDLL